jgi:ribosome-binding ATPase YchF (GTP1/OBG family)
MEQALKLLQDGKPVRVMLDGIAVEDLKILQGLNLLTSKPVLYVCNVAEEDAAEGNAHTRAVEAMAAAQGAGVVVISAAIEAEVAQLADEEAKEYLDAMGLAEPGLDRLIRAGFIRAQTIAFDDYVTLGGETAAKEAGKARDEGKEYVVQDGDVLLFRFNT